jgi:hypothetical protein
MYCKGTALETEAGCRGTEITEIGGCSWVGGVGACVRGGSRNIPWPGWEEKQQRSRGQFLLGREALPEGREVSICAEGKDFTRSFL